MQNLTIDGERLWDTLMETARIGGTPKGGICRLTLTDLDRQVRDWFRRTCEGLGLTVTVDEVGNMFALRPGRRADLAPIMIGSHLDTQPTGGKFDGVLGVLGALEAVRTLIDNGIETEAPLAIVNWTNEEGSRFAPAMLGSGAFADVFAAAETMARCDRDGVSFADAIEAIGYRGAERAGRPVSAYFELHIEQGPILEATGTTVGVVTAVQAMRWFELRFTGRESHAGTTPMPLRRDALVAAARLAIDVDTVARAHGPGGVGTVGVLDIASPSTNVVPGSVFATLDMRHPDDEGIASMEEAVRRAAETIAGESGITIEVERIWEQPRVSFDETCVDVVRAAAAACGFSTRDMVSGAGHDAAYVARVAPSAMIFVPCAEGLSHNEAESATREDCAAGAQVLLHAVLRYDASLAEGAVSLSRHSGRGEAAGRNP